MNTNVDHFDDDDENPRHGVADDDDGGAKGRATRRDKRIDTLVFQRNTERGKRIELEQRLAALEQKQSATPEPAAADDADDFEDIDKKIKELNEKARDQLGRTLLDEYHETNQELMDLRAERRLRKEQKARKPAKDKEEAPKRAPGHVDPAETWVTSNVSWFNPSSNNFDPDLRKSAIEMETKMAEEEGYSRADPELYVELDKRLKRMKKRKSSRKRQDDDDDGDPDDVDGDPELLADDLEDLDDDEPLEIIPESSSPIAPRESTDRGSDRDPPRQRAGRLTRTDVRQMKLAGFNVNDPADRRKWLDRNKL